MLFTLARSDGDPSKWPEADVHIPHLDRSVNKYVPCLTDDDPKLKLWKSKIGQALAVHTGKEPSKDDLLTDLPSGYRLFVHVSVSKKATTPRKDVYMFGRPDGLKYRSPNEFLEHALWLYPEEEEQPCKCGYCTGGGIGRTYLVKAKDGSLKRANEVRHDHSLSDIYRNLANGRAYIPAEISKSRPRRERIKGKGKARAQEGGVVLPAELERAKERVKDVQFVATMRDKDFSENRTFRQGELVWVPIPPITRPASQIASSSSPNLTPESQTISYWPALVQKTNYNPQPPFIDDQGEGSSSSRSRRMEPFWSYRVNFFTLNPNDAGPDYTDDQLLPFLAYSPHLDVTASVGDALQRAQDFPQINLVDWADIKDDWDKVVVYYAAALGAAEQSTNGWGLTNSYSVEPDEVHPDTRLCFQGLWWGAERIWLGDVVRIFLSHKHINLPVAAPSSDEEGLYPALGEEDGPIFLGIEGIFLDPAGTNGERGTNGLVTGKLYELVDETYPLLDVDELPGGGGGELGEGNVAVKVEPASSTKHNEPTNAVASSSTAPFLPPPPDGQPSSSSDPLSPSKQLAQPQPPPTPSAFLNSITSPILFKDTVLPLPRPPRGKVFRIIHSPKLKITFTLTIAAGRYYPLIDLTSRFEGEPIPSRFTVDPTLPSPSSLPSNPSANVNGNGNNAGPSFSSSSSSSSSVPTIALPVPPPTPSKDPNKPVTRVARSLSILAGGPHGGVLGLGGVVMGPTLRRETRLEIVSDPFNAVKDKIRAVWKVLHHNDKRNSLDPDEEMEEEGEGERPRKSARVEEGGGREMEE